MTTLVRWEPFRDLASLQSEMSRFMNQLWGQPPAGTANGASTWLPPLDVWETEGEIVLALDLPGIPQDAVSVEVDDRGPLRGRRPRGPRAEARGAQAQAHRDRLAGRDRGRVEAPVAPGARAGRGSRRSPGRARGSTR